MSDLPTPEEIRRFAEQASARMGGFGDPSFSLVNGELPAFLLELDADVLKAVEKGVMNAEVRELVARVRREKRVAKYGDAAATSGFDFMFGETASDIPIWGAGDDLLWAEAGGLMIPSDQGLGKSFTAQQVILGRLGFGPGHLLGQPIRPLREDRKVVYLALDRPRQIARSMARLFTSDEEQAAARERLGVWTKPIPIDILGDPYAFADWVQDTFGENVGDLVIDSVKDLTPANLSAGEVGQALDMAWKECRARGMSTFVLHHERKTGNEESRANRMPSLDNIYGSVWLTSGMDSILHIQGKQGDNLVRYTHLKAILNMLEPIDAVHDQENGRTDVIGLAKASNASDAKVEQVYASIRSGSAGGAVTTAADIVQRTGIAKASVDRYVKKLVEAGRVVVASEYVKASATPATYRVPEPA
ncbi:AAA family ATPase [Agromyces seonyuensis]|uniref:AAA family ATPase n=1 Tax=Agromyces seonyuensis TaxID=2662446 RepID=A0A6I4NW34_9MICO|nr:AAA family ATPase [Agromyces seonyuensis]MWB98311.1 AAA family ATPase [Agromyces seonyuensis]